MGPKYTVRELFDRVSEEPRERWDAMLDAEALAGADSAVVAEVRRLLQSLTADMPLSADGITGPLHAHRQAVERLVDSALPRRIGRYSIVCVLGEGGMGTVYEAEQDQPKRAVALKVIRAGYLSPQLLRRFEHESAVLGRLQHPGIAQVYEAGTVQDERGHPVPFFAMEFIKGVPLTEYTGGKRLGTRERLDLVARICDAVYHAHQKGIIHRDLKPGNILVNQSGQPKILDFGVARATDSDIQQTTMQTDIGQLIGTVPYMSPEQVGGDPDDLDTRSDVYALGVIAYELLAGRLPYDLQRKAIHEAARIIREEEPTRLSSINRTLRGDVETIVAKALEKEKTRRYQSAESLASDIRRYLKDEPIAARPASTWYQASKFAKRNKGLVTSLAAAFFLLGAGVIGTSIGLRQAVVARDNEALARRDADTQKEAAITAKNAEEEQRKSAEAQRDKAEKIAEFMSDTLDGAGPSVARGRDITMLKEMMDAAAARIEKGDLKGAPEAELHLRCTIGDVYRELAEYRAARNTLEPAVELARSLYPTDHPALAQSLNNFGGVLYDLDDLPAAESLIRESLEMRTRILPPDHPDLALSLSNLGHLMSARGRIADAVRYFELALAMRWRLSPSGDESVAVSLNDLARNIQEQGDFAEAERLFRESLSLSTRILPSDHPRLAYVQDALGGLLHDRADFAGAETLYRKSLEAYQRLFPRDHPDVAQEMNNLAAVLQDRGSVDEALDLLHRSLEMYQRLFPGDHARVALGLDNVATALKEAGDLDSAEPLYRQALDMRRRLHREDHPDVASSLNGLGLLLKSRGDLGAAEPLLREALEMRERLFSGDHPDTAESLHSLARLVEGQGDVESALILYRRSQEMYERLFPRAHPRVAQGLNNLAGLMRARGDLTAAEELLRRSLEMWRELSPGDHPDVALGLHNLGVVVRSRGDAAGGAQLIREALEMRKRLTPGDHPDVAMDLLGLGDALYEAGDRAEAESSWQEALRMGRSVFSDSDPFLDHALVRLAEVLDARGRPTEALPVWRELLEFRRRARPAGAWESGSAQSGLGACLVAQARFADAEPFLVDGFETLATAADTPRSPRDRLREACERVRAMYNQWDNSEPGKGYGAKAAEWKAKLDAITPPPEPAKPAQSGRPDGG